MNVLRHTHSPGPNSVVFLRQCRLLSESDSQATPVIELSQVHAAGASRSLTVTGNILTGDASQELVQQFSAPPAQLERT